MVNVLEKTFCFKITTKVVAYMSFHHRVINFVCHTYSIFNSFLQKSAKVISNVTISNMQAV